MDVLYIYPTSDRRFLLPLKTLIPSCNTKCSWLDSIYARRRNDALHKATPEGGMMPYIKQENRAKLDKIIDALDNELFLLGDHPGNLNYCIYRLAIRKLQDSNLNYKNLNELIGVLECVKQELYRKVAGPYEDQAELKNGKITE